MVGEGHPKLNACGSAYFQALEDRVSELEEENNCLRAALNLPPAHRPPLGKGPTGKDKPRDFEDRGEPFTPTTSHTGSSPESSTSTGSFSPSTVTGSMRPSPHSMDGPQWDHALVMEDDPDDDSHIGGMSSSLPSSSTCYPLPTSTNSSIRRPNSQQYPYDDPVNRIHMPPIQSGYPESLARPPNLQYGHSYSARGDLHQPQPQMHQQYVYSAPPFSTHHESGSMPSHAHPSYAAQSRDDAIGQQQYLHRRSSTDPQGYRLLNNQYIHLPSPQELAQGIRLSSSPRLQNPHGPVASPHHRQGYEGIHPA